MTARRTVMVLSSAAILAALTDYEGCGECSFDHGYEPEEAKRAHMRPIRLWMQAHKNEHLDACGEVNATALVEAWDNACDTGEATLDQDHPAWEVAVEVVNS